MSLEEATLPQYNTPTELISTYWPILAASFLVSLLATPLCRWYALRKKIVDRPDEWLKPHSRPIPYLGGVAIFLGWAAGVLLALVLFDHVSEVAKEPRGGPSVDALMIVGILAAGLAIMLLGLFDDLHLASPKAKLAAQLAVAVWLLMVGLGDDTILIVLRSTGMSHHNVAQWLVLAYSLPLTLLIILGACNATNLLDGMDGLCSGVLGIIAAGLLAIAVHLHLWGQWFTGDVQRVVLSLAMMGAALGFLPHNRNPAKIFMGDAGSMVLGLNAAILILLFAESSAIKWLLCSVMVFPVHRASYAPHHSRLLLDGGGRGRGREEAQDGQGGLAGFGADSQGLTVLATVVSRYRSPMRCHDPTGGGDGGSATVWGTSTTGRPWRCALAINSGVIARVINTPSSRSCSAR